MAAGLAVGFVIAAAVSFVVEALATPRASLRRPAAALLLHVLAIACVFLCVVLISGRLRFACFITLGLLGLMAIVSNAKYASLREPFVFTDLSLFSQLFAHPRLYLPFLSAGKVAAIAVGLAVLAAGFFSETRISIEPVTLAPIIFLCAALGYLLAARLPLCLTAVEDQRRCGFFAVFVAYLLNGLRPATWRAFHRAMQASPFAHGAPAARPDVVVIQSESFFDARRLGLSIKPSILACFDAARRESVWYGELTVPAWGANTMRTEFAMLSGLPESALGYARFYPYAFLRQACASLASWFGRAGYRTLAIHPYYGDFFGRKRAFRLLHIDRLIDIASFANARREGPYIADDAVADAIIDALDATPGEPAFVFAVTMENHGPLNLEPVREGEAADWHALGDEAHWRDLTVYLRHLSNADAMIGKLVDNLRSRSRETVLCFYGDHVPALPHVFGQFGVVPERSDYFIWRNFGEMQPAIERNLCVEALGVALTEVAGSGAISNVPVGASYEMTEP